MSDASAQPDRPERRGNLWQRLKWWHWLAGVAVVFLLCFGLWHVALAWQVDAAMQRIRDMGYPATAEELDEWYPRVEEGPNAAERILDAANRYRRPQEEVLRKLPVIGEADLPRPEEPLPEEMREEIEGLLAENEAALEGLRKIDPAWAARYPVDLSRGINASLPHLSEIRRVASVLALSAIDRIEAGRGEGAGADVATMLTLAESIEKEPLLISLLVRRAVQNLAVDTLERWVNRGEMSEAQAHRLMGRLEQVEDPEALRRAVVGEACVANAAFKQVANGGANVMSIGGELTLVSRITGILKLDQLEMLELSSRPIEAAGAPLPQRLELFEALDRRFNDIPPYAFITRLLLPSHLKAAQVDLRTIARLRAARTALAVEMYEHDYGEAPGALEELVPDYLDAVPADPFTGEPLKYDRRDPDRYIVYSVSADQKDHGGKQPAPGSNDWGIDPGYDIAFQVGGPWPEGSTEKDNSGGGAQGSGLSGESEG